MPAIDEKQLRLNIRKCKLELFIARNTTFFAALLANLKLELTTEAGPTAATDGISLWLNPNFIRPLSINQLLGLMLHEVLHVAFDHIGRCFAGDLDKEPYNIAADYYINLYLTNLGYEIPSGGYCDSKYTGMSTMQIYEELLKNPPPPSNYQMDIISAPPEGMSEQEYTETVTSNIVKAVNQAEIAKDYGSVPAEILQRLENVLNPALPWQVILQNYMAPFAKDDYSWSRPNRRYMPDFYLPSLYSDALQQITAGADVSASMTGEDLNTIIAEIKYIWDVFKPVSLRLTTFDTKVHLNKLYEQGETLDDLELKGGGGTNVKPLLNSIRKECPEIALIFTDGYFSTPDMSNITSDVIWIIKGNPEFTAPYGDVIHFN